MKFLKKSYIQEAIAEEAKGNYKQAAAFYSKAEEFEKVGEMYELLGDIVDEDGKACWQIHHSIVLTDGTIYAAENDNVYRSRYI